MEEPFLRAIEKPDLKLDQRLAYQRFLRDRASIENWTHFVTLNFHRPWNSVEAKRALSKWAHSVSHHMFRRRAARPAGDLRGLYFFAFKEFSKRGDPHWHLLVDVNGPGSLRFESLAARKWGAIVASGTSDIQAIGPTARDREAVARYVTKRAHLMVSIEDFCISTEFDLPSHCGRTLL